MDLFLSSFPCFAIQSETDNPPTHIQIIRVLSLYVDVYVGEDKRHAQQQQTQSSIQNKIRGVSINKQLTVAHAMTEVEGLINSILATGKTVLEQVPVELTIASCVSLQVFFSVGDLELNSLNRKACCLRLNCYVMVATLPKSRTVLHSTIPLFKWFRVGL